MSTHQNVHNQKLILIIHFQVKLEFQKLILKLMQNCFNHSKLQVSFIFSLLIDDFDSSLRIEKTDQLLHNNVLYPNIIKPIKQCEIVDSVKRSDIRGIDVLLSEKSHEFSNFDQENLTASNHDSDEVKTLKYGTDERADNWNSIQTHKSQKEAIFDHLEKIMTNWFHDDINNNKQESNNFETLNCYKSNAWKEDNINPTVSPLSSQVSSPKKDDHELDKNDALNYATGSRIEENKFETKINEEIITPRDIISNDLNNISYQTPTSKNPSDVYNDWVPKKEINVNVFQPLIENARREDAFTNQFYSNTSYEHCKSTRQLLNNSESKEEHIHIYVDQWDIENTEKKFDDLSSDAYLQSESIGIHTAKNSPLESNKKVVKETPTSEKYSITEESTEKHLNEFNSEIHTSDYLKQRFNKAKKNIESTLKDNLKNCVNSPDNIDFNLNKSNINGEIKLEHIQPKYLDEINTYESCINSASPAPREQWSPSNFDESKWIILSNKKWKSIDSDNVVSIIDDSEQIYQTNDCVKKADYLTEEILSMMFFSDIHENPMFPFRNNNVIEDAKDKFPFNKPLGINTDEIGVSQFLSDLINHIEKYYIDEIINNLEKPVVLDPLLELSIIQLYEENFDSTQYDNIVPLEIFFSMGQERKSMYNEEVNNKIISEDELENKIKYTFIHDKIIFDWFNKAINMLNTKKEELLPWNKGNKRISQKSFDKDKALKLLYKAKKLVTKWSTVEAGTRKIPPPPISNQTQNLDDIFAPPPPIPSESERNQQLREDKLCTLLSTEVNDEDKLWTKYDQWVAQVKLDLADMVLEDLVGEFAFLMISKKLF